MRPFRWLYTLPLRLRSLFRGADVERDLEDEFQFHLEQHVEAQLARGASPDEARRAALRAMDGLAQRKEQCRDMRRVNWAADLGRDLRYAARMLRRSPLFTAVAVVSLALGIGCNTAMFSVVNAVLLRSLPVRQPERLALLKPIDGRGQTGNFAYPDYARLREENRVFSGLAASEHVEHSEIAVGAEVDAAAGELVSGNYFPLLGVGAQVGRALAPADEFAPVAMISDRYWRKRFGGDVSALGKTATINGAACTIVGVAPAGFWGESAGFEAEFWAPLGLRPQIAHHENFRDTRSVSYLDLMGRLRPEATFAQAQANLTVLLAQIHSGIGNAERDYLRSIVLEPGSRGLAYLREQFAEPLRLLMGIVALVLLIACTNLASLLMARSATRQREIATRLAIGANRGRLIRQFLTESLLLAAGGGALGLALAPWGTRVLLAMVNRNGGEIALDLRPDGRVLWFALAVSLLTGMLFGLPPALRATRRRIAGLELGSRAIGGGRREARGGLVSVQVALSVVLLATGGLFLMTLRNLKSMDLGFRGERVLLAGIQAFRDGYRGEKAAQLGMRLVERAKAVPGVRSASFSFIGALGDGGSGICCVETAGFLARHREDQQARADWVGPDFFATLGIPVLAGREFSAADNPASRPVAILNESAARHFFGGRAAVGRQFVWVNQAIEVVGVVKDSKYHDLREPAQRVVYFPFVQRPSALTMLEVRTDGPPLAFAGAVRQAIREIDPKLHLGEIMPMEGRIDRKLSTEHLLAELSGFFSGLTLLLVGIGVYGMLAYAVARRTNEIGIRMALGAQRGAVVRMVMRDVARMLAPGLAVGMAAAPLCGRLAGTMLFGLKASDGTTIGLAAGLLLAVSLAAGYLPARRASRVDPVAALRFE